MKKLMTVLLMMLMVVSIGMAKDSSNTNAKKLIKYLNDDNVGVRSSAAQLLGEEKEKDAVMPLIQMLERERNFRVRIVAAVALHQIGDAKALPVLKRLAKNDPNKTVRRVAAGLTADLEKIKFAEK
ncbi:hypothetical protein B6D60_00915 [candidate division KSB1 bacterium 4484_87]|nr:MAG: hypothetical protein B6D60_00915 [candidate division KSB1 bacterium 4484_87]